MPKNKYDLLPIQEEKDEELRQALKAAKIPFTYGINREYLDYVGYSDDFPVFTIKRKDGKEIHVNWDRWGYTSDEIDMDQNGDLDDTINIIQKWLGKSKKSTSNKFSMNVYQRNIVRKLAAKSKEVTIDKLPVPIEQVYHVSWSDDYQDGEFLVAANSKKEARSYANQEIRGSYELEGRLSMTVWSFKQFAEEYRDEDESLESMALSYFKNQDWPKYDGDCIDMGHGSFF